MAEKTIPPIADRVRLALTGLKNPTPNGGQTPLEAFNRILVKTKGDVNATLQQMLGFGADFRPQGDIIGGRFTALGIGFIGKRGSEGKATGFPKIRLDRVIDTSRQKAPPGATQFFSSTDDRSFPFEVRRDDTTNKVTVPKAASKVTGSKTTNKAAQQAVASASRTAAARRQSVTRSSNFIQQRVL